MTRSRPTDPGAQHLRGGGTRSYSSREVYARDKHQFYTIPPQPEGNAGREPWRRGLKRTEEDLHNEATGLTETKLQKVVAGASSLRVLATRCLRSVVANLVRSRCAPPFVPFGRSVPGGLYTTRIRGSGRRARRVPVGTAWHASIRRAQSRPGRCGRGGGRSEPPEVAGSSRRSSDGLVDVRGDTQRRHRSAPGWCGRRQGCCRARAPRAPSRNRRRARLPISERAPASRGHLRRVPRSGREARDIAVH